MIVLDASVVVAFFESTHRAHAQAIDLFTQRAGYPKAMSVVTALEAMAHRAARNWTSDAASDLAELGIDIVPLNADSLGRLPQLRNATQLSMPDAIVLDLALQRDATLVTLDVTLAAAAQQAGIEVAGSWSLKTLRKPGVISPGATAQEANASRAASTR